MVFPVFQGSKKRKITDEIGGKDGNKEGRRSSREESRKEEEGRRKKEEEGDEGVKTRSVGVVVRWRRRYCNALAKRKNYQMLGSVAKDEILIDNNFAVAYHGQSKEEIKEAHFFNREKVRGD